MRLEKITISNFKGLRSATFEPTTFGCLVGENNAGKSSVLQAVVCALDRPSQLPESLFYDDTVPIEFVLHFVGVTLDQLQRIAEEHRQRIAEIVNDECLTIVIRYHLGQRHQITVNKLAPKEERFREDSISNALKGKKGAAIRQVIQESYAEFSEDIPGGLNTVTGAKEYLNDRIMDLLSPNDFEEIEAPLPTGIGTSITSLLPEPIYIPAVKNLSDDLKTTQSTSFGRLLGLLLDDMSPDLGNIEKSLSDLNKLLNRILNEGEELGQRHKKVQELESRVQSLLGRNFPQVKVELEIPPPELRTILNSAQIFIDDGSRDLIDHKGDGIKRSLTFALLQAYVEQLGEKRQRELDAAVPQRPLIFLFEEPELYLHPKSQRVLFSTLSNISRAHQVVVTTHSPIFFEPGVTASFIRVAKQNADPKPVGVLYPINFSLDENDAQAFHLVRFENTDAAFFSQRVVLIEGESDAIFFKHIAKLLNSAWDFEEKNVSLVRVLSKGNFAKFREFFNKFGISVKLVADLDSFFEGFEHLGSNGEIVTMRHDAISFIDRKIRELDIKAEPKSRQIKDRVHKRSWRERYEAAKNTFRAIQESKTITDDDLKLLDGLFTWEQDIARVKACSEPDVKDRLVPVLDTLRGQGICVLVQGAIEDYYPEGTPSVGTKPVRALAANALLESRDDALAVSTSLAGGRLTELEEVFEEIFRDL